MGGGGRGREEILCDNMCEGDGLRDDLYSSLEVFTGGLTPDPGPELSRVQIWFWEVWLVRC